MRHPGTRVRKGASLRRSSRAEPGVLYFDREATWRKVIEPSGVDPITQAGHEPLRAAKLFRSSRTREPSDIIDPFGDFPLLKATAT